MNGILRKEALVILTNLSRLMSEKLKEPISRVHSWVNIQIEIEATRLYSCMIRGSQLISTLRDREMDWYLGLGLDLAQ